MKKTHKHAGMSLLCKERQKSIKNKRARKKSGQQNSNISDWNKIVLDTRSGVIDVTHNIKEACMGRSQIQLIKSLNETYMGRLQNPLLKSIKNYFKLHLAIQNSKPYIDNAHSKIESVFITFYFILFLQLLF